MIESVTILMGTAAFLGLFHTAIGPDHYLPFIVLGKAEGWTYKKTVFWTAICGLGHVASSIVVGAIGIAVGWSLNSMEWFEGIRGSLASYTLMGFGALYLLYGLYRAFVKKDHTHFHAHGDGSIHKHSHDHKHAVQPIGHDDQAHDDTGHMAAHRRTMWALFLIFVLGPCEPLIPLLMVPAAAHSFLGIALVAGVFSLVTVSTMIVCVSIGFFGLKVVNFQFFNRYVHAFSGATILLSGLLIQALGI